MICSSAIHINICMEVLPRYFVAFFTFSDSNSQLNIFCSLQLYVKDTSVVIFVKVFKDFFHRPKLVSSFWITFLFKVQKFWRDVKGHLQQHTSENFQLHLQTLHKKWSFPLRISTVSVTKSAVFCGFGHIYWRNL